MRRLIAIMAALLLLALPALAEPMSTFDYTDDILQDGSLIYYFPEISLRLPADWRGRVMARTEDGGAAFYQIASHEKYLEEGIDGGGFLFRLGASVNGSFSELPAFRYLGFCEGSAMNYYLELPTDYPAYPEADIRAEYDAMLAGIDYVAENAEIYGESGKASDGDTPTVAQARYYFEHNALPRYFYEDPENMLNVLEDIGIYQLWEAFTTENGIDAVYTPKDCVQRWYAAGDGTTLLQVQLPEPDANTLCYRIYFIHSAATGKSAYYTVESDEFLPEYSFICTWDAQRTHAIMDEGPVLDKSDAGYETALAEEARHIAGLAGFSSELSPDARHSGAR